MRKLLTAIVTAISGLFLLATPVIAAHYIFRGNAEIVHWGEEPYNFATNVARFISDANYVGFGAIDVTPKQTITLDNLTWLSTDYFVSKGCDLNPVRFRLRMGREESGRWRPEDEYLYADLYPVESISTCGTDLVKSGDIKDLPTWYIKNVGDEDQASGPSYMSFDTANAVFTEEPEPHNIYIQEILLLADGGTEVNQQVVYVDNVEVNDVIRAFDTPSFLCKDDKWMNSYPSFESQHECMVYFQGKDTGKPLDN